MPVVEISDDELNARLAARRMRVFWACLAIVMPRPLTALGLHALQHRGQEAAGIVTFDGARFHSERRLGWW